MKRLLLTLVLTIILVSCSREPVTLHILETSDMHGTFGSSMSSTAQYLLDAKEQYGDNLIVLDCGDFLQGSPEVFYANFVDTIGPHLYSRIFNYLPYSAITVGNHDFEAGKRVYDRVYSDIDIPVICANIVDSASRKPIFKPYTVIAKSGYKVAILGLTTTYALDWLPRGSRSGTSFVPIKEAAAYWVKRINKRERPDLLIGLFHAGNQDSDYDSALKLSEEISGIDLICCGHTHKCGISQAINKQGDTILVIEPGYSATDIAEATITLTPQQNKRKPKIHATAKIVETADIPQNKEFNEMVATFLRKADMYYDIPVSYIDSTIFARDAINGPCAWTDIMHKSFRRIAMKMGYDVDITIVSPSTEDGMLQKGPLTIKDFISIYPYENTLSVVELSGYEVKDYLEYAHSLPIEHSNGPIYIFDSAAGIDYTVTRGNKTGDRIAIKSMSNGDEFNLDGHYLMAMSSFRAFGGGGHMIKSFNWDRQKISSRCIASSKSNLRDLFIEVNQNKPIDLTPLNNWQYR